jgi:hypothetical protein
MRERLRSDRVVHAAPFELGKELCALLVGDALPIGQQPVEHRLALVL